MLYTVLYLENMRFRNLFMTSCDIVMFYCIAKHAVYNKVFDSQVKKQMMKPGEVISSANLALLPHPIAESVRRVMKDLDMPLATVPENVVSTLCSIGEGT